MTAKQNVPATSKVEFEEAVKSLLFERLELLETFQLPTNPTSSAKQIAKETLQRYTTLATDLGLKFVKDRLEDLSFKILYPEERSRIISKVGDLFDLPDCEPLLRLIRDNLEKTLLSNGLSPEQILARQKTPFSIWQKMKRKNLKVEELRDILGFRVVVSSIEECYLAVSILHDIFPSELGRFKDYIRFPKDQVYQSLHTTIIGPYQKKIEVQVRTGEMDIFTKTIYKDYWKQKTCIM